MSKGEHLGELEEIILMITASLIDDAYAVSVMDELKASTGRSINVSAVHSVMKRLEKKGFLQSHVGGSTNERGGRSRRIYSITAAGKKTLQESMNLRVNLYQRIPGFTLNNAGS
ncbi:PadR family transcriptional regulator [Ekhidna sp.]|uniref:PadR family transcriptional regulator n=1 Tax=Ekhidna sp. TaxID=2608089 RepID=UPI003CCC42A2